MRQRRRNLKIGLDVFAPSRHDGRWNSFACFHILARIPWSSPRVARSGRFIEPDQRDLPCPVPFAKILRFALYPNQLYIPRRPAPQRGGGSRSSRTRGGTRGARLTNRADAESYRQILVTAGAGQAAAVVG